MTYPGSVVLEKIFKWPHPIFVFLWLSPLWRGPGSIFEQFRIPFTQGWFILSLIEIGLLVLEKKIFLKNFSVFLHFCYYLPLGKDIPLHLINLKSPLPKDDLCQVWSKLAQRLWRRSRKCKSLQTDGRTDRQQATRKAHLSFQLRWAKKKS
jgi:hypothetical protein